MNLSSMIAPELPVHAPLIEVLHAAVFGPGANTRAAFRLREQGPHDLHTSFVALKDDVLVATVRMTPIVDSTGQPGYLLGPLAVSNDWQNAGFGRALVRKAITAANENGTARYVLLVGDAPYYAPLGFEVCAPGRVSLPGPVDPRRLLVHALGDFDAKAVTGLVKHAGS
ncbi:MAG: N-acetyltransferase [Pseudomonadota bacterium]